MGGTDVPGVPNDALLLGMAKKKINTGNEETDQQSS
jgi:hypothetical protein